MGLPNPKFFSRLGTIAASTIAVVIASAFVAVPAAMADTAPAPAVPVIPETVSSDSLDTVQINGVVWDQVIVGNTVYAGGNFTTARPAGSAAGVNTVTRTHLLAYNLTTGVLLPWAPVLNGQVRSLAASPDGTRLYVGGEFTTVNGASKLRIAAFDIPSGTLNAGFQASTNSPVYAVSATNSTVFMGGQFSSARGVARSGAAAATASTGAITNWAPVVAGGRVYDLVVSPDGAKVVLGGQFTTINGSGNPGYGLAIVDSTAGGLLPSGVNSQVRDAAKDAAIFSLTSDGDSFYGTGFVFGAGGNMEGTFRADWASGDMVWVADCHGDTYGVAVAGSAVYTAGHAHYCGNIDAFPQTEPWTFYRALAFSKDVTGVNTADPYGYYNWQGTARPDLLTWFPTINSGTFTGQYQGAWNVAANSQYAVYGGEFTNVNGKAQQGLVRFAVKSIAPNTDGPRAAGSTWVPTLDSPATGTVRVSWPANWDRDNEQLTYALIRNGATASPVYTAQQASTFWDRPTMTFIDTGLTPGQSYSYRVRATDPFGNATFGATVSIVVSATGILSSYASSVIGDKPTSYWRLGDAGGSTTSKDSAGSDNGIVTSGVTFGESGPIAGDPNTAAAFSGDSTGLAASSALVWKDDTFSVEGWFKTTTTSGGKIIGFGNSNVGNSTAYDRHIYMDPSGHVQFGVYPGATRSIASSKAFNDGQWHHVVASLSPQGMTLYVDAKKVASNPDVTNGQPYWGYWRIGGDNSWNGDPYFAGSIDEVAVYPAPLSPEQIVEHYTLSGRTVTTPPAPADAYGASVYAQDPILYWRLGEATGTNAVDSGQQETPGLYSGDFALGAASGVSGTTNTSVDFTSGVVASSVQFDNPTTYSTEIWFNTTTNQGGKLTGFGRQQSGTSSSYDRHVYMQDDGRLVFGTWTGQTNTITTPLSYNDGAWHQVVAAQSSAGMKLYVDGQLVGTNPQTGAESYPGYWRAGGDTTWGSSSPWFDGLLDEFAVYDKALAASTVLAHYDLGKTAVANLAPSASFVATTTGLNVAVDASASTDADGTIAGYSWNFGDGGTATGATASHTYAADGTYTVTLTVTDDDGATDVTTRFATVEAINAAPTASFVTTKTGLAIGVDASASTDAEGPIASYAWEFGDGSTGTGVSTNYTYPAAGTYVVTLTVTDAGGLTDVTTRSVTVSPAVNTPPTASFTATVVDLDASFNASASTDADGSIASYAWDFGDGSTGTGATTTHSYNVNETFVVTLTVTDNGGQTATTTRTIVTTIPSHLPPVAVFSVTSTDLTAVVDPAGSSDPDGTVQSYEWNWGDGTPKTYTFPALPGSSHNYAAAGTYTITLVVMDNGSNASSVSHDVTVVAPTGVTTLAEDTFTRTSVNGWGSATTGGVWTVTSAANSTVSAGSGALTHGAGTTRRALLNAVSSSDATLSGQVSIDKAATGGGAYAGIVGRQVGAEYYQVRTRFIAGGSVGLQILRGASTVLANTTVAGITYTPGSALNMRVQVSGTSPTTIRGKIWPAGTLEPLTWNLTTTDSTPTLQVPGSVGVESYVSGSATNTPVVVRFDNYLATTGTAAPTPNVAPTAVFQWLNFQQSPSFIAFDSTDPDGVITSYSWSFGDGTTATGVQTTHAYVSPGTYTVTLTVTDDDGAIGVSSQQVQATAPPVGGTIASDGFLRTVTGGWGSADIGGVWTTSVPNSSSVDLVTGSFSHTAGTTRRALLNGVVDTSVEVSAVVTTDKVAVGGNIVAGVVGRQVGTDFYQGRVRLLPGGSVAVQIMRGSSTLLANATVAGLTNTAGQQLNVKVRVTGTSPTTISAKVWAVGQTEPATWQVTTTDATAALQTAGSVGVESYLSSVATNGPVVVRYDSFLATHAD